MTIMRGTLAVAAVLTALPAAVGAQQAGQGSTTRPPDRGWMGRHMMGRGMREGMMMEPGMMDLPMTQGMRPGMMTRGPAQYIEGRLAFLKAELGITSEQAQTWNAYADALRDAATSMQGMHD